MNPAKLENIRKAADYIVHEPKRPGLVLEFGVFEGQSLCALVQAFGDAYTFVGFDSFEGLPATTKKYTRDWFEGSFKSSLENTQAKIAAELGDGAAQITLIPGFYESSLTAEAAESIGLGSEPLRFVHIDCDLHSSTMTVLNFLQDYLRVGTYLLFDEWLPDEKEAWEDFCCAFPGTITASEISMVGKTEQVLLKIAGVKKDDSNS